MNYIVWENLGPVTKLVMNQLHYGGLLFMILAYSFKIYQFFQMPTAVEGTPSRGAHKKAIRYAYMTLAMPWELEIPSVGRSHLHTIFSDSQSQDLKIACLLFSGFSS